MQTLIQVYNSMIHRIQVQIRTIQENASAQEKLKDQELENLKIRNMLKTSELKALQMQINPHFLFNTLNMIARTADFGDTDRTSVLLQKTAQLLRYNLDFSGKMVSLANEIEMLGNYVYLQEERFGSKIFFDFDLNTPIKKHSVNIIVNHSVAFPKVGIIFVCSTFVIDFKLDISFIMFAMNWSMFLLSATVTAIGAINTISRTIQSTRNSITNFLFSLNALAILFPIYNHLFLCIIFRLVLFLVLILIVLGFLQLFHFLVLVGY